MSGDERAAGSSLRFVGSEEIEDRGQEATADRSERQPIVDNPCRDELIEDPVVKGLRAESVDERRRPRNAGRGAAELFGIGRAQYESSCGKVEHRPSAIETGMSVRLGASLMGPQIR